MDAEHEIVLRVDTLAFNAPLPAVPLVGERFRLNRRAGYIDGQDNGRDGWFRVANVQHEVELGRIPDFWCGEPVPGSGSRIVRMVTFVDLVPD